MHTSKQVDGLKEAVITCVHRTEYLAESEGQNIKASLAGRFHYLTFDKSEYPVVGDKVLIRMVDEETGVIESVEVRKNVFQRSGVGLSKEAQVLAANVDIIFVCMGLDKDFNIKKLQNFLSLTYSVDAQVVILLTKKDLVSDPSEYIQQVRDHFDEELMVVSSYVGEDMKQVEARIAQDTSIFVGSSGVGKSSIINALLKEEKFQVNSVRESDSQGRHTTTHRELIHLPNGGKVIDTPGIRIVYSHIVDDLDDAFEEVLLLAEKCKFRDCKHEQEPGCNVQKALEEDVLSVERFEAYKKIVKLNRYHKKRDQERARMLEKKNAYPK